MYSNRFRALAAVVGILFAGHCLAQDLDLSFDGSCDGSLTAEAGSVQATSLDCVLTTSKSLGPFRSSRHRNGQPCQRIRFASYSSAR